MPNFESVDFILARAQATRDVQAQIAETWLWGDKTVQQWDTDIAAVRAARNDDSAAEAAEQEIRGERNLAYTRLERRTMQTVSYLKIVARRNPQHATLIANLPAAKTGRPATLARARAVAEAWRQINPDLAIAPNQTLPAFDSTLAAAESHDSATTAAKVAWRHKAELLADLAAALDTDAKDWYALATRQCAPGTAAGDLIRGQIPTLTPH